MAKYLYLNGSEGPNRWTLPEEADVEAFEMSLLDGLKAGQPVIDVEVRLGSALATLHLIPATITAFAVVEERHQTFGVGSWQLSR